MRINLGIEINGIFIYYDDSILPLCVKIVDELKAKNFIIIWIHLLY